MILCLLDVSSLSSSGVSEIALSPCISIQLVLYQKEKIETSEVHCLTPSFVVFGIIVQKTLLSQERQQLQLKTCGDPHNI